jgi:hypothetical protein
MSSVAMATAMYVIVDYSSHKTHTNVPIGEKRNACRISVGKPEGKRPLGSPRRRWVDNIKMDVTELGMRSLITCTLLQI